MPGKNAPGSAKKPTIKSVMEKCLALKQEEIAATRWYTQLSELASKHQTNVMDVDRKAALDKAAAARKERVKLAKTLPVRYYGRVAF